MRYIYMVCLVLSSLFTYKPSFAESNAVQYAFFIPKNSFQSNVDMPRAVQSSNETAATPKQGVTEPVSVNTVLSSPSKKMRKPATVSKAAAKKDSSGINKIPATSKARPAALNTAGKSVNVENSKKEAKHVENKTSGPKIETLSASDLQHKDLSKLLALLPYPDFDQPKFKQLYAIYALDLRTLYRKGKFLPNPEQDAALAKADTMRRFEVK